MAQTLADLYKQFHDNQTNNSIFFSTLYNTILERDNQIEAMKKTIEEQRKKIESTEKSIKKDSKT